MGYLVSRKTILDSEGVNLKKNKYDFLNSTFSSITKIAPCRDPGSATWMAVGTGFGIVQFICHDQFYHPEMDEALGRNPLKEGPAKGCFFVTKPPPSSKNAKRSSKSSTSAPPPQSRRNSRQNSDRKATIPRRSLENRRS
ncbi:unnamed protein product [Rodentolepis nana]|uniref:Protein kinase domain-containing protein n=1 Tax=Rodentolepis nana TaxID=102285 RepID=A0A0R3TIM8_RODNA|nr:unnamed protein product [Rodentolepis nana]